MVRLSVLYFFVSFLPGNSAVVRCICRVIDMYRYTPKSHYENRQIYVCVRVWKPETMIVFDIFFSVETCVRRSWVCGFDSISGQKTLFSLLHDSYIADILLERRARILIFRFFLDFWGSSALHSSALSCQMWKFTVCRYVWNSKSTTSNCIFSRSTFLCHLKSINESENENARLSHSLLWPQTISVFWIFVRRIDIRHCAEV